MAIGNSAKAAAQSYVAVARELAFGTYPTTTSFGPVEPISCSFKVNKKSQKLDTLSMNRGVHRRVQLDKEVAGTLEQFMHPEESVVLMATSLGGGVATTSLTGAYSHIISAGNFDGTIASASFVVRKGDTHEFAYQGGRVNSMKITAQVGEPVKVSYDYVFKTFTSTAGFTESALTISSVVPFTYAQGTFAYSGITEYVTGFELTVNNNLKSDKDARSLGSDELTALPPTRRDIEFKITQRFDTTTTLDRFMAGEGAAVQLVFTGASITAEHNYKCTIDLAKVYPNTPDPELKGSGDILLSEIAFDAVVDNPYTSTGYDIKVTMINNVASY